MADDLQRRFHRASARLRLAGAVAGGAALVLSPAALAHARAAGGYSGAILIADLLVAAFGLSAALGGTTALGPRRALHRLLGWAMLPALVLSLPAGDALESSRALDQLSTALSIGAPLALILSRGALPRSPRFNLALATERGALLAAVTSLSWLLAPLWLGWPSRPPSLRAGGVIDAWLAGAGQMPGLLVVAALGVLGALGLWREARRTRALALQLDERELAGWLQLPADSFERRPRPLALGALRGAALPAGDPAGSAQLQPDPRPGDQSR